MTDSLSLPRDLLDRIHGCAEEAYPAECCGLLLGSRPAGSGGIVRDIASLPNMAAEDGVTDRYAIAPEDYLRIDRQARATGHDILGCYHSHPEAEPAPSAVDLATAWPWFAYLIVSVRKGRVASWRCWLLEEHAARPGAFRELPLRVGDN